MQSYTVQQIYGDREKCRNIEICNVQIFVVIYSTVDIWRDREKYRNIERYNVQIYVVIYGRYMETERNVEIQRAAVAADRMFLIDNYNR